MIVRKNENDLLNLFPMKAVIVDITFLVVFGSLVALVIV